MYNPAQFYVQRLHAAGYPIVNPTIIFEQKPMKYVYVEINLIFPLVSASANFAAVL